MNTGDFKVYTSLNDYFRVYTREKEPHLKVRLLKVNTNHKPVYLSLNIILKSPD